MIGSPVEVVQWDKSRRASDSVKSLVREIFQDNEPGFQIDGAERLEDLLDIFKLVRRGMPFAFRRQFIFNSTLPHLEPLPDRRRSTIPFHSDQVDGIKGLAIQQNIHGMGDLLLASLAGDEYNRARTSSGYIPDYSQLKNVRHGSIKEGGLTVIAEGGYGTMGSTFHLFDRREYVDVDEQWIRYGYSPEHSSIGHVYDARTLHLAETAFGLLRRESVAA